LVTFLKNYLDSSVTCIAPFGPHVGHNLLYVGYIVKQFGSTTSEAHCKLQCILDPVDQCHFAVYVASQATCWIGNFLASVSKIGVSNSGIKTGWIYYQSTQDDLYFTIEVENTVWPPKISRPVANVPNREICSAMCNLIEGANCQLFVYRPDTSDCLLGEYSTATNNIATMAGEFEMVSIRDGNLVGGHTVRGHTVRGHTVRGHE
jgi:hypothetical protein